MTIQSNLSIQLNTNSPRPRNSLPADQPQTGPENSPHDTCEVSAAIGELLKSKSEARKQRKLARKQTQPYQVESRRPLICLAFVLPFLALYEVGTVLFSTETTRSGIDLWFHQALQQFGFDQFALLPLLTIGILIGWHHRVGDLWNLRPTIMFAMLLEAAGLGLILYCLANSLNLLSGGTPTPSTALDLSTAWWGHAVSYVGSGIYEEVIFRIMMLVPIIYWGEKLLHDRKQAMIAGVVLVSLIFAALHYNFFNPAGNQFEVSSFSFRFIASTVFCSLFLFRGFGIAVGAHVAYDVLTQV
ncbi:MAG: CPBP family intramembrane metalloprotease [Mariniblastus sp.]|nr:CPBP family intramembrane metalloprotease [Mariniblastus sp.]